MLVLSRLDYHAMLEQAPILYLIGIIALVAVLLVGSTRALVQSDGFPSSGSFSRCQSLPS